MVLLLFLVTDTGIGNWNHTLRNAVIHPSCLVHTIDGEEPVHRLPCYRPTSPGIFETSTFLRGKGFDRLCIANVTCIKNFTQMSANQ